MNYLLPVITAIAGCLHLIIRKYRSNQDIYFTQLFYSFFWFLSVSILIYVFDPFSLLKELFIIYFNTICSEGLILKILLIGSGPESNISNLPSSGCPSGGSPKRGGEGISILPNEDSTSPKRRKVSSSGVVASFSRVDSSNTAYLNTQVIITERNFKRNCKY